MNAVPDKKTEALLRGTTSRKLAKLIFDADVPEDFIKEIPAQSLYLAVLQNGIESSADLMSVATPEQCQLMLDLDCWTSDEFSEENFWNWLRLTDGTESLDLLLKILKCVDLKLIALLLSRYATVHSQNEPTDEPPGPLYYTPDKGYTWIELKAPDSDKQFLLGRLLALIFETSAELFYQLLSIPSVATNTMLEEQSYGEREKRLLAEGIPDKEFALEICRPIPEGDILKALSNSGGEAKVEDVTVVEPLLYDSYGLQPLSSIIPALEDKSEFEQELTLIMNAAIIRWNIPLHDYQATVELSGQVKGILNIGLEILSAKSETSAVDVYKKIGLRGMFHCGLDTVLGLRKTAKKISDEALEKLSADPPRFRIVAGLREPIPQLPNFLNADGTFASSATGELEGGFRALKTLTDATTASDFLISLKDRH